jgi:uncharacterized protein YPO0396
MGPEVPTDAALFQPAAGRHQQWRVEYFLLCNWGGFGGVHRVSVDPDSTLISGSTGAGKSTVLDAYTCLMRPNQPLNSASNEAGAKSRGDGIRSTLSYVRGQHDRREAPDGTMVPLVLRGADDDTWSAIAVVFASTSGARFTLLRLFYAPREAARPGDMSSKYATFAGRLEEHHITAHFERLATESFRKDHLEKAFPGLRVRGLADYENTLQKHLGIGEDLDSGGKALRLLYNLQRGTTVNTVNALFKELVLERPATFDTADAVIASFDSLDQMHQEMSEKKAQLDVLDGIDTEQQRLTDAQDKIDRIDTLRLRDPDRSPFVLWSTRRKVALLEQETDATEVERKRAEEDRTEREGRCGELQVEIDETRDAWTAHGGDRLLSIDRAIEKLEVRLNGVRTARTTYGIATADLDEPTPTTQQEFDEVRVAGSRFLTGYEAEQTRLKLELRDAIREHGELKSQRDALAEEERQLALRGGNISPDRHRTRVAFAEAARMDAAALPFVGELIDMDPVYEQWRVAADAVLGGFANILLVDERHRGTFKAAIDKVKSPVRIQFRGVSTRTEVAALVDPSTLAGRIVVNEGPFAGWIRDHLNREFAYECVDTPEELGTDDTPRVTRAGQTQAGRRGAHGGHGRRHIGFSNEAQRAELRSAIERLTPQIEQLDRTIDTLEADKAVLGGRRHGYQHVQQISWSDIDEIGIESEIRAHERAKEQILSAADKLAALTTRLDDLKDQHQTAMRAMLEHEAKAELCKQTLGELKRSAEEVRQVQQALEADASVQLSSDQSQDLDDRLERSRWDGSLARFDDYCDIGPRPGTLVTELRGVQAQAEGELNTAAANLTKAFEKFHQRWPSPNRGIGLASYEDYLDILADLRKQGLSEQRDRWARKVIEWGGEDLSELFGAYERTHHEIEERLDPIKRILAHIPFGNGTTLDIKSTRYTPTVVRSFKDDLRRLASGSLNPSLTSEEVEAKFETIRATIDRVRPGGDEGERTLLLDVRKHLKITAREVDAVGVVKSDYDYLGEKSGGQAQTLTAFIGGAALRYHLGDEDRNRPRFAPVVLDEAFIKSDEAHTTRAVTAWQHLGFQLIVGTPEGQFTALERAMNLVVGITKDSEEYSYVTHLPRKDAR